MQKMAATTLFLKKKLVFYWGDITLTEVMSDEQNPEELPQNCQFSITLEAPKSTDLMALDGEASGVSWASTIQVSSWQSR